jgi:GNAT superfamily N-acetyltransferase
MKDEIELKTAKEMASLFESVLGKVAGKHILSLAYLRFHNYLTEVLNTSRYSILYKENGKIVGAVQYKFWSSKVMYVYNLAVMESHQGQGIGTLLLNQAKEKARSFNCDKIVLYSFLVANPSARKRFYLANGFKIASSQSFLDLALKLIRLCEKMECSVKEKQHET